MTAIAVRLPANAAEREEFNNHVHAAMKGKLVLSKHQLLILIAAAEMDATLLLETFPSESVPEEIRGIWDELRSSLPLYEQLTDWLMTPDEEEPDSGVPAIP